MGHSTTQARKRLTLPLPLRAKMIGCAMFIGGFMGLITSAQLDPISAHVERVIDGDTIQVSVRGEELHRPAHRRGHPGDEAPHQSGAVFRTGGKRLHQGGACR